MPCGWSLRRGSVIRSTTLTTRTRKLRQPLAQDLRRGDRLHRDDVAGAGQHDVGVAVPSSLPAHVPDAGAAGAVLDRLVHGQALQLRLLVDDDQVDVGAGAQAVVGDREQAVGVRRQVDPADVAALGEHDLDQARTLVARSRCGRCATRSR